MCNRYFSCKASPSFIFKSPPTSCSLSHRWDPGLSTPKKYISYFCLWLTTLLTLFRLHLLSYHVAVKKADISMYTNTHPCRKGSMSKTDRQAKKKKPCWCVLVSYLLKTFQENATGVQHKKINSSSIRRNGSRGRKSRCPGNDASSEWKL